MASKRPTLVSQAKAAAQAAETAHSGAMAGMVTSTIHMPKALLRRLRLAAMARSEVQGGRPSVSAIVVELLERHGDEIDAIADGKR